MLFATFVYQRNGEVRSRDSPPKGEACPSKSKPQGETMKCFVCYFYLRENIYFSYLLIRFVITN